MSKSKKPKKKQAEAPIADRLPTLIYLISPLDVGGDFPDRLARALDAAPVAAFQFRVKGMDEHEAAKLAEPLQRICGERDVAFIVNDSVSLAKRLGAPVSLAELGMPREGVERALQLALANPYWNPAPLEESRLRHLLEAAYEGRRPDEG